MNNEIFNKNGSLKKKPPQKYMCKNCDHVSSKVSSRKLNNMSFYVCSACGGSIKEREEFKEWNKRNSGQWDMEEKIIEYLRKNRTSSIDEIYEGLQIGVRDRFMFDHTFADLCYHSKLDVIKIEENFRVYRLAE